jgi:hypothetical protein
LIFSRPLLTAAKLRLYYGRNVVVLKFTNTED